MFRQEDKGIPCIEGGTHQMYTDHYHFLHEALVEVKCVRLVEAAESLAALKSLVLANIEQWDHLLWPFNTQTPPDFIIKWI